MQIYLLDCIKFSMFKMLNVVMKYGLNWTWHS